jgi:tetratricopeptide (TPR) repeat protein
VALDEWDRALELLDQQERMCREHDHPRALLLSLLVRGALLHERGDEPGAVRDLREATQLARAVADNRLLDRCLGMLAEIEQKLPVPADVRPLLQERADVLRRLGRDDALREVLVELAVHHRTRGEPAAAAAALDELAEVVERDAHPADLQRVAELRAMLDEVDESAGSMCQRANELKYRGEDERALELFGRATSRYPDYLWGWADMGICLLEMSRFTEAERALTRAVELGADDVATWAPLGAARLERTDIDGAWECLRVCVETDIADRGTRRLAAMTYHRFHEAAADEPGMTAILEELREIAGL